MKTPSTLRLASVFCLLSSAFSAYLLAQGPLTPPGAPAPTMKTLDQVEARTPITSAPFTISTSGSYYLTGNLTVASGTAITISADQVTLDLNGFSISSTASPASGSAVNISGVRRNVTVKNGHIRGTTTFTGVFNTGGFSNGISTSGGAVVVQRVSDVNVEGMAVDGIVLPISPMFTIERCRVNVCGGIGLRAGSVADSHVDNAGQLGISANVVTNCSGKSVGTLTGHSGIHGNTVVENSIGTAQAGIGIQGLGSVNNSYGESLSNTGLLGESVQNSKGLSPSNIGLSANMATNCYGISGSSTGLQAGTSAHNCRGNTNSGTGLQAPMAHNCHGSSDGVVGISCTIASFCRGQRDGGIAISAVNAIGCWVLGTGTVNAANKSLGTP